MTPTLRQLFEAHTGRESVKYPHYFELYDRHLTKFRGEAVTLLEIGIGPGGSLQVWKEYLGPQALILGLDICDHRDVAEDRIIPLVGSQADPAVLDRIVEGWSQLDIVIDDGSHEGPDTRASFERLFPHLSAAGVYAIEDLHTSYRPSWRGGYGPGTPGFMERVKSACDELQAWWVDGPPKTEITQLAHSIHVYPLMTIFERGPAPVVDPVHYGTLVR